MPRTRATRANWYCAAAGEICGSSPEPDAVTRSTGTGAALPGSAACNASMRCLTASVNALLVGPRFEPVDEAALFGDGVVADGRGQKYFGSANGWPISSEPSGLSLGPIRLPLAACVNVSCATPVTTSGYTTPVITLNASSRPSAGRSRVLMAITNQKCRITSNSAVA